MTDFTSAFDKLERAEHHLADIEQVLSAWIETAPVSLRAARRADGVTEDWWIQLASEIPPVLNVILGDCVHNFRSALDHLAMALAVDNGADIYNTTTMFPIFGSPPDFQSKGLRRLSLLAAPAQQFIEGLQPYHRTGKGWLLWELNELDIADKHRTVLTHKLDQLWQFAPERDASVGYPDPWLIEDGALYATVTYNVGYTGPSWQPPFTLAITVERSNRRGFLEVAPFLRVELLPQIRGIINEAQARFP